MSTWPFADVELSRRLERCEGHANRRCVEARARLEPSSGAEWLDVGGTWAMFDGVGSPLTQTFGLGVLGPADDASLETLEHFFESRGATVRHEVSPMGEALGALVKRRYVPFEQSSVLFRPLAAIELNAPVALTVRRTTRAEAMRWADVNARGWSEDAAAQDFLRALGRVLAEREDGAAFWAEAKGEPIAAASLSTHGGVALLAGASTLPSARGRGAQSALLAARLQFAREAGCDVAMMGALPGSTSQRNAERHGFRIAYTRTKWTKA